MEYKRYSKTIYLRLDPDDEIISTILNVCRNENIASATFQGIGGCKRVKRLGYTQTTRRYEEQIIEGNLDMGSIIGNITTDYKGELCHHTHTVFSYVDESDQVKVYAGHTLEAVVSYAAEIEIRPVEEGKISRTIDENTGAQIWHFEE